MFSTIEEIMSIFASLRDNRELVPEIFNNPEIYLNLNCTDFGVKKSGSRIDDFCLNYDILDPNCKYNYDSDVSKFINYIIGNKKLLNGIKISREINYWIDNVFGVEQLPENEKSRKKRMNIFYKDSYESKLNLITKMKNLKEKKKLKKDEIIKKIISKINLIISFGQTPNQIFFENHPKYGKIIKNNKGDFEYDLNRILI